MPAPRTLCRGGPSEPLCPVLLPVACLHLDILSVPRFQMSKTDFMISILSVFQNNSYPFVLCICECRHLRLPRFPTKHIRIIVAPASRHSAIYQKYLSSLPPVSCTVPCTCGGSTISLFFCRPSLAVPLHTSLEFAFLNISACFWLSIVQRSDT